jgi:hypothetical protein
VLGSKECEADCKAPEIGTQDARQDNSCGAVLMVCSLRRDALTLFRASLVLITCIAILAVDFQAFPRRFGKAETFGTGAMGLSVWIVDTSEWQSWRASSCKA